MVPGLACCAILWESEVSLLCTASAPLDAVEGVTDGSASAGLLAYMMRYVRSRDGICWQKDNLIIAIHQREHIWKSAVKTVKTVKTVKPVKNLET